MVNYQQYLLGIQERYATLPRSTPAEPLLRMAGALTLNQAQMRAQTIKNNFKASLLATQPTTAEEYDGLLNSTKKSFGFIDKLNPAVAMTMSNLKSGRDAYLTTVTAQNQKALANFEFNAVEQAFNQQALGKNATVEQYLNLASPGTQQSPFFRQKADALRKAAPTLSLVQQLKERKALDTLRLHYANQDFALANKINPPVDEKTWQENYNNSYLRLPSDVLQSPRHQLIRSESLRQMQIQIANARKNMSKATRSALSKDYNTALANLITENAETVDQIPQIVHSQTSQWSDDIHIDPEQLNSAVETTLQKQSARIDNTQAEAAADIQVQPVTEEKTQQDTSTEPASTTLERGRTMAERMAAIDVKGISKQTGIAEPFIRWIAATKEINKAKAEAREVQPQTLNELAKLRSTVSGWVKNYADYMTGVVEKSADATGESKARNLFDILGSTKNLPEALNAIDNATSPEFAEQPETVNEEHLEDQKSFEEVVSSLRTGLAYEDDPATAYVNYARELSESANSYLQDIPKEQREAAALAGLKSLMEVAGDKIDRSDKMETFIAANLPLMTNETRKRLLQRQAELLTLEAKGESPAQKKQNDLAIMYGNNPISINKLGDPSLAQALEFANSRGLSRWKPEDIGAYKQLAPQNIDHVALAEKHLQSFKEANKDLQTFAAHKGIPLNIPAIDFTLPTDTQIENRITQVDALSNAFNGTKMLPIESDTEKAAHKAQLLQKTQPQIDEEVSRALIRTAQTQNIDGKHLAQIYDKDDLAANYTAVQVSNKSFWLDRVPKQEHNGSYESDVSAALQQMIGTENYRTNSNTYDALIPTLTRSMQQQSGVFSTKVETRGVSTKINTKSLQHDLKTGLAAISPGNNTILVPTEYKHAATKAIKDTLKRPDIFMISSSGELKQVVSPKKNDVRIVQFSPISGIPDLLSAHIEVRDPVTGIFIPLMDFNRKNIVINLRG